MAEPYVSLTVELAETESELAQDLLHELGCLGLEVRDAQTPPMPGAKKPQTGEALLVAYFDAKQTAEEAQRFLEEQLPSARVSIEAVPEQDWSTAWRAQIRPVVVGRLWVGPPWELAAAPEGKTTVVIEPKMAFGTGDHPTTSLCLAAVDEYLAAHPGASVLDVGCGTAVLGIAAKKLGAGRVVGIDNDPVAVQLAQEAAKENGVELELSEKSLSQLQGPFELVIANILANTLVELAPSIAAHTGDRLVLAGVLVHQKDEVSQAYLAQGLTALPPIVQGEWIRLDFVRT